MELFSCLPESLRNGTTSITPITPGLSGAGVFRVDCEQQHFVLKVAARDLATEEWRNKVEIQRLAATAGVAPHVIHASEEQHATLSEMVGNQPFASYYWNPATRDAALALLGTTIRRLHDLPAPEGTATANARVFLEVRWQECARAIAVPHFVIDAVQAVLDATIPTAGRGDVLSHNDMNPSNLAFDGERLMLLDWETSSANEPWFDLATIAVFMRMDDATCARLISFYEGNGEGAVSGALPPRFRYDRKLVAVMCGVVFLDLAHQCGFREDVSTQKVDDTMSLGEFYQQLRAGTVDTASASGKVLMGLALVKESLHY